MMSLEEFLALPTEEVARLVRQAGPQVCVFPINGTRRWFVLEHGDASPDRYVPIAANEYIRLFSLLFEHGIDVILSPLFGTELLRRGEKYVSEALGGALILESPGFLEFYKTWQVKVRFYGDYRLALANTPHAGLLASFDRIAEVTSHYQQRRLFFGLFANDAAETTARLTIEFYHKNNRIPTRRELIEAYYGEALPPATLFVGFQPPSVFDYPLLGLGEENLYFTIAPTPYMNRDILRSILYDHFYLRRIPEPEWFDLSAEEIQTLRDYYRTYHKEVLGLGSLFHGIWRPR
ncbi:MAG: diterpene synthase [Anaerolineales bacterium]